MANIITQSFADGDDKALSLANEEYGRLMEIGSDWTKIRVGVLLNIWSSGTENILTGQFRMGIASTAGDHIGSLSADLWYGVMWGSASGHPAGGGTFTYNAGSGDPYYTFSGLGRVRALNGVHTVGTNTGSYRFPKDGGSVGRRWPVIFEATKSGSSMNINAASPSAGSSTNRDFTLAQFRAMMASQAEIGSGLLIDGVSMAASGATDFADYTTHAAAEGEVDAVHIGWNKDNGHHMRIFALEVYRRA